MSIDGIGAFDLVSRNTMMRGLLSLLMGVVSCCQSSVASRPHSCGKMRLEVRHIPQGEGGEQGDPLMPLLFWLANMLLLRPCQRGSRRASLRALGRSTWCVGLPALEMCTRSCSKSCSSMLTSASTKAKPRCGIEKDWNFLHVPGCRPPRCW